MLLEQNLGFTFSFNATAGPSQGFAGPGDEFPSLFLNPCDSGRREPVLAHAPDVAKRLAGTGHWNRYALTTIDKALVPLSIAQCRVAHDQDGTVTWQLS